MLKRLLIGSAVLVVVAAAWHLATAGTDVDLPMLEAEIAAGIEDQLDISGVSVDCPEEIEWQEGDEFHCFAEDRQGRSTRVTVSMENDQGEWSWMLG